MTDQPDQIEQLFQRARATEEQLPESPFLARLNDELEISSERVSPTNYDWILVVAALLAVVIAFVVTPVSFWLSALPYLNFSVDALVLVIFAAVVTAISCFWLFDIDPI